MSRQLIARDTALPMLTPLAGRPVLFAMAADAEYGPALRARITPLMTGVGPVESAIAVTAALTRLHAAGTPPAALICLGSAGSRGLEQGRVYQASRVAYRDMDASAMGFPRGVTPFLDLPPVIPLGRAIPGLPQASLSSGGGIVSGSGYDAIAEDMVDMESFAVCRAAIEFGVPLIGLRGISDGAEALEGLADWTRHLQLIDGRLAAAIDLLEDALARADPALNLTA